MTATKVLLVIGLIVVALGVALVLSLSLGGGTRPMITSTVTSTLTSTATSTPTTTATMTTTTTKTVSSSSTTSSGASTYAASIQGLQLRLSIDANSKVTGQTIQVNVSEFNTLDHVNNVTCYGGECFPIAGLSPCPNTHDLPFGLAVYKGHYTGQNVSQGTRLQIFPPTICPSYVIFVSGYSFQPNSDLAVNLPSSGVAALMTASVDLTNETSAAGAKAPFPPGNYTLVASDQWGALAFLPFQVLGSA